MAENAPPSPPFFLTGADGARLAALRRANETLLAPRVTEVTVAEGISRELRERQPFSQGGAATISEAEQLVLAAKTELAETVRKVQECNEKIAAQREKNSSATAECRTQRSATGPVVEEVSRKRKLVEDGVAVLVSSSSTAAQRFVGEDLSATLTTCDGCKQMLDRQMAAMQNVKKEKETATERTNRLRAEVEPLRSAVKKLRTTFGATHSDAVDGNSSISAAQNVEEEAVEQEIRSMCVWYSEVNDLIAGISGVSMDTAESFGATTARINIRGYETGEARQQKQSRHRRRRRRRGAGHTRRGN